MKHSFLFFYFVGTFARLQMNFGINTDFVINQCKTCKIQKKNDAVLLRY